VGVPEMEPKPMAGSRGYGLILSATMGTAGQSRGCVLLKPYFIYQGLIVTLARSKIYSSKVYN
jgi:hypothetical protein